MPRAWRNYIANPGRKAASPKTGPGQSTAIPEGNRNIELTRIAGQLRHAGLTAAEICDVLIAANQTRCKPPLEQAEVDEIARNVAKYPAGNASQPADAGEQLAQTVLDVISTVAHTFVMKRTDSSGAGMASTGPQLTTNFFNASFSKPPRPCRSRHGRRPLSRRRLLCRPRAWRVARASSFPGRRPMAH